MLTGFAHGELILEERAAKSRARRLKGTFPYGKLTTISDGGRNGGRPKKETFAPRAFAYNVEREDVNILFLSGHRYDRPLASRAAGTLRLKDADDALHMEAILTDEIMETSWARDFLAAFAAGLVMGLSPGFRIPPQSAVPDAEKIEEEDPTLGRALIRTIFAALIYELSAVTVAQYEDAEISERNWTPSAGGVLRPAPAVAARRWRL
ncbi:phage prohead protease, HK97 family [Marinibacterium anthonyi]|nr:phage prohead protease, HK97 family [Marinibacterium anthonyi]